MSGSAAASAASPTMSTPMPGISRRRDTVICATSQTGFGRCVPLRWYVCTTMMVRMADPQAESAKAAGRNVHRLRASAGMSLADLAAAGGISKTTLHGIEQGEGNPTLSTLWALATALGVSLGELLEPPPAPPVAVVRAAEGP